MTRGPGRPAKRAILVLVLAMFGSLVPTASVLAATINPASGGNAISADQFGTTNFTTLTGPGIAESSIGELGLGTTTVLNVPAGFKFNAGAGNTSISGPGCDLAGTLTVTATQATFTVTTKSTVANCILTFIGLQVQPTSGSGLTSGNITKTGTSSIAGGATSYGALTKVAGAVTELIYLAQPSAVNNGGQAFGTQPALLARDQFGNTAGAVPVTLAITPGTGATGAALTCTTNPVTTTAGGVANFTGQGCKIDLAGTYKIRATSGAASIDSGTITVNVGAPSKLVFKAYPAAATPALLTPQPRVAITDAGGNTVTAFPATSITLAINKAAATFTCTGGLAATTVNGEAQFAGCTQTAPDSEYALTATVGFANTTGPNFAVAPAALVFIAGPGTPGAGQPFPTPVQVAIQNNGTTVTSGVAATVTLAIGTNPSGGVLTCTGGTSVGTVGGIATFTGCSIDKIGTGYTLTATAGNVLPPQTIGPGTSAAFNVTTATSPATISITTFCGTPTPKSTSGPNQCAPDTSKSPPQANIKLPQTLNEGVWLQAHFASNGANRPVTFEVSKDHVAWVSIGGATTDASGNARLFYRPSDNRFYRVSFAGTGDLGAASSPEVRVVVRALVFLRPTNCTATRPCRIRQNDDVRFTVTARPNRPELPTQVAQYVVQRKSGSTFVTVVTDVVTISKSTGSAEFDVNFNIKGTWRIRVNLQPTSVNANSFPTEFEYYSVS